LSPQHQQTAPLTYECFDAAPFPAAAFDLQEGIEVGPACFPVWQQLFGLWLSEAQQHPRAQSSTAHACSSRWPPGIQQQLPGRHSALNCCVVQVAWNKVELSAHDMEPEQQERLFSGKFPRWASPLCDACSNSSRSDCPVPHATAAVNSGLHGAVGCVQPDRLVCSFVLGRPGLTDRPTAEIRVLRTLHHRNIITCYEW
jgi:hypothetical protein